MSDMNHIQGKSPARLRGILLIAILLTFTLPSTTHSQEPTVEWVNDKYTSVGQLGMTITNFGILGEGWNNADQPSCRYKQHTEILREQIEHFSFAGLWIGGKVNGDRRVSTAIVDGVFPSAQEGFEYIPTSGIQIRSSISSTAEDPMAEYYSPYAVSHQDFVTNFQDFDFSIPYHTQLGISVHLESYAWNFTFADAFVILNYTIINQSANTIKDIYAGIWADVSVANMNYTSEYEPGGGFTWYDNLDGYDESIDESNYTRDIAYQYDADGDDGWAESYIGLTMLGGTTPRPYLQSHYNQWVWSSTTNDDYPEYTMPLNDYDRYDQLMTDVPIGTGDLYTNGYPNQTDSWLMMISCGPLGSQPANVDSSSWELLPGDSCNVVFAVVTALWNGSGEDSGTRRANLHINSDWAQKAYDGEDKNRNNILDEGEDINQNGKIDRYILPEPPPVPNMTTDVGDQTVTIYWQNNAEHFIDPVSLEKDFEGYRIYGARKTYGDESAEFTLLAEFDLIDSVYSNIGYNTGFDAIRIKNDFGEPDSQQINGRYYHYKYTNDGVKNGWLNYYAITSYDRGNPDANLESLESSEYANRKYVYPGVKVADDDWTADPKVYPNPYRGQATWEGYGSREQMIWFTNLPSKADIRIFTLAGDIVDIIHHDESRYAGQDIVNIDEGNHKVLPDGTPTYPEAPHFSGGEHAWDLITRYEQAIASGLYLFSVENKVEGSSSYGRIKEGKFLIIK